MKIIFDMDGTIANLYSVIGWLDLLCAEDSLPYEIAEPMVNMSRLAKALHKAQNNGIEIAVVSWGSINSSDEYFEDVVNAKMEWLKKHLPSVEFNEIAIVPYGISKSLFANENDILFDDNEEIRNEFIGTAYEPSEIFEIIKGLIG